MDFFQFDFLKGTLEDQVRLFMFLNALDGIILIINVFLISKMLMRTMIVKMIIKMIIKIIMFLMLFLLSINAIVLLLLKNDNKNQRYYWEWFKCLK